MARASTKSSQGNVADNNVNAGDNEPKDDGNGEQIIDPSSIGYGDEYERDGDGNLVYGTSGKPRKKRGRRSGSGNIGGSGKTNQSNKRNNSSLKDGVDTLSKTLLVLHMGISSYAKFDGFMIEEKEADALSASIVNVMDQFDWTPDPRMTAIAGLITTSATIYGPRMYLYREHLKEMRKKKKEENTNLVSMVGLTGVN